MSPAENPTLLAIGLPVLPLAWNFVVPAFLGFLVGTTYVLTFGIIAAVVVWVGATVLLGLWLATGLYPFNRLALIGYAVGAALVGRAAWDLVARAVRRLRGRLRVEDLRERDLWWAGEEAIALMQLAGGGVQITPYRVDRRLPGRLIHLRGAEPDATAVTVHTRLPRGGPVHVGWVQRSFEGGGFELDRVAPRGRGSGAEGGGRETPTDEWLQLMDRADARLGHPARLDCRIDAEGRIEVGGCARLAPAIWSATWLAGAGVDLAADPVSTLEHDLIDAAWGWDRLLLGERSPGDVRFFDQRPYVSFEATRGASRAQDRAEPRRRSARGLVLMRDLVRSRSPSIERSTGRLTPQRAVSWTRQACRSGLAPMHVWSEWATRAASWVARSVPDEETRARLLRRVQAPETRHLQRIAHEREVLERLLPSASLAGMESWATLEERLRDEPPRPAALATLRTFLIRHGHRGAGERALTGPRWSDGPGALAGSGGAFALASLASLGQEAGDPHWLPWLGWLDPVEWLSSAVAALGGFAVARRVRAREHATRAFARLREALVGEGSRLVEAGKLGQAHDVFHLTLREWLTLTDGLGDVRDVVERRRADFEHAARRVPHALVEERGDGAACARPAAEVRGESPSILRGMPVSAGVARGEVCYAVGWEATDPRGRILVLGDANPSHAELLPLVTGLVCERGGLLSHLAIVARELGIPAVMGVAGAIDTLAAGTRVEVDGSRGDVRRVLAP